MDLARRGTRASPPSSLSALPLPDDQESLPPKDRVFLISLGCAKNLVDSEHMLGLLHSKRFPVAERIEDADVVVVNTCAFVQKAVEESIDTILEVSREKKRGALKGLFVVGCLVQRYGYKLQREVPEVDGWLGTGMLDRIPDMLLRRECHTRPTFLIGAPGFLADHKTPRLDTAPFYSSYLKIAEGCSHRCTYCTIPRLRGPLRSRSMRSVLQEAHGMVRRGVREINLVAQDTTLYGSDLRRKVSLEALLESLANHFRGAAWIRTLYSHPRGASDRLLRLLAGGDPLCPYLDIPLQHVNSRVLEAMGRPSNLETPRHLVERIRSRAPGIAIRTTLMVGFPGETDEAFKELYDFVKWASFEHLGVFVFSAEDGTPAARLKGCVEKGVASERGNAILELQESLSRKRNRALVGRVVPVLVEGVHEETPLLLSGRTATMAPEVDGRVLITKGQGTVGQFERVRIIEAHAYDLVGEIL